MLHFAQGTLPIIEGIEAENPEKGFRKKPAKFEEGRCGKEKGKHMEEKGRLVEKRARQVEERERHVETDTERRWYEMPSHQKSKRRGLFLPLILLLATIVACLPIAAHYVPGNTEPEPGIESEANEDKDENKGKASLNTPVEPESSWYADGTSLIPPQGEARDLDAVVEEGMMNISVSTRGEVEGKRARLRIENKDFNKVDQKVTIALAEDDEPLFESGALAPGFALEEFELARALPPGNHEALATFVGYDRETHAEKGKAGMKITLVVA